MSKVTPRPSSGVFRLDDTVVICGSHGNRDAEFEFFVKLKANAVARDRGLPVPVLHSCVDSWSVVIAARGCVVKVQRDLKKFWDELLVIYAEWIALCEAEIKETQSN